MIPKSEISKWIYDIVEFEDKGMHKMLVRELHQKITDYLNDELIIEFEWEENTTLEKRTKKVMQRQLQEAIDCEDYEEAEKIQNEIKNYEK